MSDKIKENENEEITAEDLDDVAGGRLVTAKIAYGFSQSKDILMEYYGGPDIFRPKPLTPEEWKKLEEERKKIEREKKIEQILKLARELDEDRSNR